MRQVLGNVPRSLHDGLSVWVICGVLAKPGQRRLLGLGRHAVCGGCDTIDHREIARHGDQAGVGVRVDQAGQHEPTSKIIDFGAGTSVLQGVGSGPDEREPVAVCSERFSPGLGRVLGVDSGVHVHRHRRGGLRRRPAFLRFRLSGGRCHRDDEHPYQVSCLHHRLSLARVCELWRPRSREPDSQERAATRPGKQAIRRSNACFRLRCPVRPRGDTRQLPHTWRPGTAWTIPNGW